MKMILLTFVLMLSQVAASSEDVGTTNWQWPRSYWKLTMVDRQELIEWDHRYPTRKKCIIGGIYQMQEALGIWMTESQKIWLGFLCTPQTEKE